MDPVRELLAELVKVRVRRLGRAERLSPDAVSADELDLLLIDLLGARLELARHDREYPPAKEAP